jgi:hypothetical protein
MNPFLGVTDNDWFAFLSHQPGIDEADFFSRVLSPPSHDLAFLPNFLALL